MRIESNHGRTYEERVTERLGYGFSDLIMASFISAFGNSEAKAMLMMAMRKGVNTPADLHKTFLGIQGLDIGARNVNQGWALNYSTLADYCGRSFHFMDLVTATPEGFVKNAQADNLGAPLAALLVDPIYRHRKTHPHLSLSRLYGSSTTSSEIVDTGKEEVYKKTAAYSRYRILKELLLAPLPLRLKDFSQRVGETDSTTASHLKALRELLEYRSIKRGQEFVEYTVNPDFNTPVQDIPLYYKNHPMSKFLIQLFTDNPGAIWTYSSLVSEINNYYPGERFRKEEYEGSIGNILSLFKRTGFIEEGELSMSKRSILNITSEQRALLEDLVGPLMQFQLLNPDIIQKGKKLTQRYIEDPEAMRYLATKARLSSPAMHRTPRAETADTVVDLLHSISFKGVGLTMEEIVQSLKEKGQRISSGAMWPVMRIAMKKNALETYTVKNVKRWRYRN